MKSNDTNIMNVFNSRNRISLRNVTLGRRDWAGIAIWLTALSLITLDLDRFKAINDSFGHAAGDRVIADLAGLLDDTVGSDDLVARLGGEEFAILLPGRTTAQAQALAERMRWAVARDLPVRLDNAPAVTASFGVAELQFGERLSDLCRRSDLALYEVRERRTEHSQCI